MQQVSDLETRSTYSTEINMASILFLIGSAAWLLRSVISFVGGEPDPTALILGLISLILANQTREQ